MGAVPLETDPRSFSLVRRDAADKQSKTFCHAHVDELKLVGTGVQFRLDNLEEKVIMTCKDSHPKGFCGMQYAYGANHEVFVHIEDAANSLGELCKASSIHVDNLVKPLTPMAPGIAKELMTNLGPKDSTPTNQLWYASMHGLVQWMEHGSRIDVSFPVRVLGPPVGSNTPAHN